MTLAHPPRRVPPSLGAYLRRAFRYDPETGALHNRATDAPIRSDRHLLLPLAVTRAPDAIPRLTRLSAKQVIYALHHDRIPKWITHTDGDPTNLRIDNLRGANTSPRWSA